MLRTVLDVEFDLFGHVLGQKCSLDVHAQEILPTERNAVREDRARRSLYLDIDENTVIRFVQRLVRLAFELELKGNFSFHTTDLSRLRQFNRLIDEHDRLRMKTRLCSDEGENRANLGGIVERFEHTNTFATQMQLDRTVHC